MSEVISAEREDFKQFEPGIILHLSCGHKITQRWNFGTQQQRLRRRMLFEISAKGKKVPCIVCGDRIK